MSRMAPLAERLLAHLKVGDPNECWEWTGLRNRGMGYGRIAPGHEMPTSRKWVPAHRAAFWLANGYLPQVVRHTCDNPPCCNPRHLQPGTHFDNTRDMYERGRSRWQRSPDHTGNADLHGTISRYTNYDCRCSECSQAWTEYRRKYRQLSKLRGPTVHGIASSYDTFGCRCNECREAYKANRRRSSRAGRS